MGVIAFAPVGITSLVSPPAAAGWVGLIAGGAALQLACFLLPQRGYRLADVGVVYPVARGVGPLLSVIAAIMLLGERPGAVALAGALLAVAGVVIIGLAGTNQPSADRGRRWLGIRYGALVGVIIAGYTLWDAAAVTLAGLEPVGYYWASMVVQLLVLGAIALR